MNDHLRLAQLEYLNQRYRFAVQFALYVVSCDPDNTDALRVLGMSHLQLDELEPGIAALEHLSLLEPLDDDCRIALSIAYGSLGKPRLSRDLLMKLVASGRMDTLQLLSIATGLEAIDEPQLAMETCRQAGKQSPDSADVHYQMGYYTQLCGHPASVSETLIRHAIELDPRNLHFRIGLASLLIRLDRKYEALDVIDPLIPAHLETVTCRCCLKRIANLFFDCDDLQRARICAARLATMEPVESRPHVPAPIEAM